MSDRANGWLLILGGLAIGLVLWLSPSKNMASQNLESKVRRDFDGPIHAVASRHQTSLKSVLTICFADFCVRLDYFDSPATE